MATQTDTSSKTSSSADSAAVRTDLAATRLDALPRASFWMRFNVHHYVITALIVVLCGLIGSVAHTLDLTEANIVMIFMANVAFVATRFGSGPAIFAAIFGVLVFDFFFVEPFMSFAPSDAQYFVTFTVMLGYGLLVSRLASQLHTQIHTAQEQERRTAQLYRMTRELSTRSGTENLVEQASRLLIDIFSAEVVLYFQEPDGSLQIRFASGAKMKSSSSHKWTCSDLPCETSMAQCCS